jgi:hypothetical protein
LGRLEKQTIFIKTGDFALKNKFFVAIISAKLATNPDYQ